MKIVTIPHQLQAGTPPNDAQMLINANFKALAGSFNGFAVENIIAFPDNTNAITIAAGGMGIVIASAVATSQAEQVKVIFPRINLYVDAPVVAVGGTSYDANYMYPTGALLTTGQLKVLLSTVAGIGVNFGSYSFTGTDGLTYTNVNDIFYVIRNGDSASHTYYLTINSSVYTTNSSPFR